MARAEFCSSDGYCDHPDVGRCGAANCNHDWDQEDDWDQDDVVDDEHDEAQHDDDEDEDEDAPARPVADTKYRGWAAADWITAGATAAIIAGVVITGVPGRRRWAPQLRSLHEPSRIGT